MKKIREITKKILIIFTVNLIMLCTITSPFAQNTSFAANDNELAEVIEKTSKVTKVKEIKAKSNGVVNLDDLEFEYDGNPSNMIINTTKSKRRHYI